MNSEYHFLLKCSLEGSGSQLWCFLVEVKRPVQNVQPSVSERKMESGSKKCAFPSSLSMSIASSAMPCKPLWQGTVHTLFSS